MRTVTIQLTRFLIGFWVLLGTACQPTSTTITLFTSTPAQNTPVFLTATPKSVLSLTPTPTTNLLPTTQFMPTPTETATPKPTATLIPLPTLSPDEAMAEVQRLYETNNDCLLPCWWGITPGITNWNSAKYFLTPIAVQISERLSQNPDYNGFIFAQLYLATGGASHHYVIYNDLVVQMEGYIEMTPLFDPTIILATYGPPSEVIVVRGDNLFFFYPEQGFLLQYELVDIDGVPNENKEVINGVLHSCFVEPTTYLVVWSPAETFTLSERLSQTSHFRTDPTPGLPLEEVTGMTIETFYQTFQNTTPPLCLEIPLETLERLWPGR